MRKTLTKTECQVLEKLGFEKSEGDSYELNLADITSEDTNGTESYIICDPIDLQNLIKNIYEDAFSAGQISVRRPIIEALGL